MKKLLLPLALILFSCGDTKTYVGEVERTDPALDGLIPPGARPEVLAEGFEWSEGPVWVPELKAVLFSDVPKNVVHQWSEAGGLSEYLAPSGYTSSAERGGEMGSNGLTLDNEGRLVLCQHGDRRVARMDAPLNSPAPLFNTLADQYQGGRFNSPNDVVFDKAGNMYFTDPPYGLEGYVNDPAKELPFQGIYKLAPDGSLILLDTLSRPNGIALSPDESTLYVANSDPDKAIWMKYTLTDSATLGRVFFDATSLVPSEKGLPDGLRVDGRGNLFATGPGGVFIFDPSGKQLGKIRLPVPSANCAFDADRKYLYITADMYLLRITLAR
jgi:gluconolactonase